MLCRSRANPGCGLSLPRNDPGHFLTALARPLGACHSFCTPSLPENNSGAADQIPARQGAFMSGRILAALQGISAVSAPSDLSEPLRKLCADSSRTEADSRESRAPI